MNLRSVAKQIICMLNIFKLLNILYLDLKLENIYVIENENDNDGKNELKIKVNIWKNVLNMFYFKISNFNKSHILNDKQEQCENTDLETSPYLPIDCNTAPEIILGMPYNHKIDIWSFGCILAELASGTLLTKHYLITIQTSLLN